MLTTAKGTSRRAIVQEIDSVYIIIKLQTSCAICHNHLDIEDLADLPLGGDDCKSHP